MKQGNIFRKYMEVFLTMLKIGAFTFGGGYAMIALLERELIEKKKWIQKDDFINMVAIAESTPGPIAVNSATYIGYSVGGVLGSVVATLGVVIPSFVIIFIISLFFDRFLSLTYVAYAFKGIRACVIYLILTAGIKLMRGLEKSVFNISVAVSVTVAMLCFSVFAVGFPSVLLILISGTVGVAAFTVNEVRKRGDKG